MREPQTTAPKTDRSAAPQENAPFDRGETVDCGETVVQVVPGGAVTGAIQPPGSKSLTHLPREPPS